MTSSSSEREQRFNEIVAAHLEAVEAGQRADWRQLQERYPDLATDIAEFFTDQEGLSSQVAALRALVKQASPGVTEAVSLPQDLEVGDYRLLRELGRGGMGVVYEAEQKSLGRRVALKVLPWAATLDGQQLQRFHNEAQAAAQLHHTHIVPIFEVGRADTLHYYAMQLIEGQSLAAVLRDRTQSKAETKSPAATQRLTSAAKASSATYIPSAAAENGTPSEEVVATPAPLTDLEGVAYFRAVATLGVHAAEALEHAHQRGVIHRDIKPANLLLDARGELWITDFGLAKAGGRDLTRTGDVVGTLRYLAPERFSGQADARSDIYSLGLTLYEMLTLRPAFAQMQQDALIQQVLHAEPARPRRLDPRIPRDLETIVLKAIAREPSRRYRSANELAEDLRRFLADRPIHARRIRLAERAWRWCRRNPLPASLIGSVAVLLLVFAVHATLNARWLAGERNQAVDNLRESYLAQAQAHRWSGRPGRRSKSLEVLDKAAEIRPGLDLRNEAIACLALADVRLAHSWTAHTPRPQGYAVVNFDRQLQRYVETDARGAMSIRRLSDQALILQLPGVDVEGQGWLSGDGRYVVAHFPQRMKYQVWDLDRQERLLEIGAVANAPDHGLHGFSHDGRHVLLARDHRHIGIFNLTTGQEAGQLVAARGELPPGPKWEAGLRGIKLHGPLAAPGYGKRVQERRANITRLALHPDGKKVAVVGGDSKIVEVLDLESGKVLRELTHPGTLNSLCWHPDGELLAAAFAGGEPQIYLWDLNWRGSYNIALNTAKLARTLKGAESAVTRCAFNHAGDLLASAGGDGHTRLWDTSRGKVLLTSRGEFRQFSHDDRRLAFVNDREIGVWEVASGRACRSLFVPDEIGGGPHGVSADPHGALLVSTHDDGVRLWDLAGGRLAAHLTTGMCRTALFSSDGRSLLTWGTMGSIHRWTIERKGRHVRIGPPLPFVDVSAPNAQYAVASPSHDGRWLAAVSARENIRAAVIDMQNRPQEVRVEHANVAFVALSPDAAWLMTGTQNGSGIKIWEARTGRLVKDIEAGAHSTGTFSPDSKLLITSSRGYATQIWDTGTWQAKPYEMGSGRAAFSADGTLFAIGRDDGTIELIETASGRQRALLTPPQPLTPSALCFTPDGSGLAVSCAGQHLIQLWDLGALRQGLADMNLAGDWPAYAPREARDAGPLTIEVLLGVLRPVR